MAKRASSSSRGHSCWRQEFSLEGGYSPGYLWDGSRPSGEAPVGGLGTKSHRSRSSLQTLFIDFDCRNDQRLKSSHFHLILDQYISRRRLSNISQGLASKPSQALPLITLRKSERRTATIVVVKLYRQRQRQSLAGCSFVKFAYRLIWLINSSRQMTLLTVILSPAAIGGL